MKKYIPLALSIAFVLAVNIYFRSYPIHFPQLKAQAKNIVEDNIRQYAVQDVFRKFPQYDNLAKDKLIKSRISEYKKQNKKVLQKQIQQLYSQLKDKYQDDRGQTYLMELDCWHWARYVDNIVRLGHPGDEVVDGKQLDKLMLSPFGYYLEGDNLLYYLPVLPYKLFCLFKPVPIFTFLFYVPLLFAAVFIIVLYLFSFSYAGYLGAIVSCLFVGLSPIFLPRSCAGWFDKDILCLLFPTLVVWTYLISLYAQTLKKRIIWLLFSSFCVGLFCFTWTRWWFIFLILVLYELLFFVRIFFVYLRYKDKNLVLIKQHIVSVSLFSLFTGFWVIVFCGLGPFGVLYRQITDALILNKPLLSSIWPNVFYTVGELRRVGFNEMAHSLGGTFVFISSLLCLILLLIRALFNRSYAGPKRESIIILTIWFLSMLFATFRGVRFIVFLLVPLGISLGWMLNEIYGYFRNTNKRVRGFILVSLISIYLSIGFIEDGYKVAKGIFPLMDDVWYKVLMIMKNETPVDSVIDSWWDFGDWFKAVAKRKVIFDGQSQNVPQAYWVAKALLSGNEQESMGILRMLNNGGNKAFEAINDYLKDPLKSVLLLESVIYLDPERAKATLLDFLPLSVTAEVMRLLFSNPGNTYFIVDPSMQFKITAISYLGNWDFDKVYMVHNFNKEEKEKIIDYLVKLGRNNDDMQRLYQEAFLISSKDLESWISHPVQFHSRVADGQQRGNAVFFENGFIYNPNEQTIYTNIRQIPRSLFLVKQDNLVEVIYTNSNLDFSALVFKVQGIYKLVLLDRALANSLFVRMYYLGGSGLRHFKSFIDAGQGNDHIMVFRIVW